ncbi:MAG: PSD1 and planctomycete cytochrome C domain-containing protein, partial [Planctomycetaceae bacterium]
MIRPSVRLAIVVVAAAAAAPVATAEKPLRFDRDVRPILAEHCYACHGPGTQEAGLRLDSAEEATRVLESGERAVVAGNAKASAMLARIAATDPDVVMPPPHTNKPLAAAQKELLAKWIAAGAPYERHWSFTPIVRPEVPAAADPGVTNPIDRFLEARLAAEKLPVAPEADRRTLARRLAFALTGLPPTPAEVEAFVNDAAADAADKLVDRLLASPHHGEEMARHWLDAARYADTHGLHLDNERQTWAYRDWVVKAFNDAMPFDRFTIEQLGGDLLPNATTSQKTATGFSRCNVTTSEGGSINDELLFRYAVDRAATTINAFMGMTGQCAVCHSHKFDPISHNEFYSLYAFFNSAADPGFDGNSLVTAPAIKVPTAEQERRLAELVAARPALDAAVDAAVAAVAYVDPATTEARSGPERIETVWLDDAFPAGAAIRGSPEGTTAWLTGDAAAGVLSGTRSLERTATGIAQDYYESGAAPIEIRAGEEIFAHVWLDPAKPPRSVMIQFHTDGWKHRAVWGDANAINWGSAGTPSRHHAGPLPEAGKWMRLAVPATAVGLAPGAMVTGFALTQFDGHVRWDRVGGMSVNDPAADPARSLARWWADRVGKDKLDDVPQPLRELVKAGPEKTTAPEEVARIRRHWLKTVWVGKPESITAALAAVAANDQARVELENAIPQTFIFTDLPKMRDSFVMLRGAYDKPGEKVVRATPAFLPPLSVPEGTTPNRLDLAKWLVAPEHPLTARVAANRLWQQFFGTGLVKTSEDFGLQGEPPSHPELLDWLAAEYRASGWNTRHMVRLIVTSRAFRRASLATPELITADPENRLLARGPRFRLDAEQIRDNALAVSGLLVRTMGGKGVKPYQPPNIWEPVGFTGSSTATYQQDTGEALYRRSLYTFLKRTAPPPFLVNFDAPNREQFCARRERSNTPLQALQLMNDVQHVEAARALAARALAEGGADDAARISWLVRTVLARDPAAEEASIVADSLAGHRARYAADEA